MIPNRHIYLGLTMIVVFIVEFTTYTKSSPVAIKIPLTLPKLTTLHNTVDVVELERHCLELTLYGEARGETDDGITAVAWVIINRTNSRRYPDTVCDVVLQSHQFESLRKTSILRKMVINAKYGIIASPNINNEQISSTIRTISKLVYNGRISDPTSGATHFWSPTIQMALGRKAPTWSEKLEYKLDLGNHRFYR